MTDPDARPDPDVLLARARDDEARSKRGKLKLFVGYAPGVGKTWRMLQVARDLVYDHKRDVVVGIVETHKRTETAAMLLGLTLMPRRKVEHRGQALEELDLDALLARRPAVALVDELAHTNAPGSRHAKRWQDVVELLDAGIDVFSTLNIQHIESLNDVVARITGIVVQETVPDAVFARADEVEVVDVAPDELTRRLREGKVYLPDQAERALSGFFREGNLLALREILLRYAAARVDDEVLEYRARHGVDATWPAGERVLVCVGPAPSSRALIRGAARIAEGVHGALVAVTVETSDDLPSDEARRAVDSHLAFAESLGATVVRLRGTRVAEALLAHARTHNVTRIVLGKPTHPRLRDLFRGSLLDAVVRESPGIEVHLLGAEGSSPRAPQPAREGERTGWLRDHLLAVLVVAATTAVAAVVRWAFAPPDLGFLYLAGVMVAALRLGHGASTTAAALSVAAYDFFFVPPYHTFAVADVRYLLTFAMMFVAGFLVSRLATRVRRAERDASARLERTTALFSLSRALSSRLEAREIADVGVEHVRALLGLDAAILLPSTAGLVAAASAPGVELGANELGVARWVFELGKPAGRGTDTLDGVAVLSVPLMAAERVLGALAVRRTSPVTGEQREMIEAVARQLGLALERARLATEARETALRARAEELRNTLLSAVSHDLRTPLAAITGAATSMRDAGVSEPEKAELLESVCEEAERLERLVENLLDMSRLESGGHRVRREWVPLDDVIGSALARVDRRLGARKVQVSVADDVGLVSVDPVSFAQVFVNLFDNAAKYTPETTTLTVTATRNAREVVVRFVDDGPGLPEGAHEAVFDKFYRGAHPGQSGVGLGLPICRGLVEAHGGTLVAEPSTRGATFVLRLPVPEGAPVVPRDET